MIEKEIFRSKNHILDELVTRQLKDIPNDMKFNYSDLKRICKYIETSIFDENKCCLWKGYVTNNNTNKGKYINFYFKKKKVALHRLLYCNFVEKVDNTEFLRFSCENKGKCCNIKHLVKFKYNINVEDNPQPKVIIKKPKLTKKQIGDRLTINFD